MSSCFGNGKGLLPIARLIANAALVMGGGDVLWHIARPCPYIRPDSTPCYDEDKGTGWIDCPVCGGRGAIYNSPIIIKGVYTDNSNKYTYDASGGFMLGEKTLSVPSGVVASVLKDRGNFKGRRVLRDKFSILGQDGQVVEVLFLKDDPSYPAINGSKIYAILQLENNY